MKHKVKRVHFVGIGGAGMSGIAEVLATQGFRVSGSDLAASPVTRRLAGLGITIAIGHDVRHVAGVDAVVVSAAVAPDNPEVQAAREQTIVLTSDEQLAFWNALNATPKLTNAQRRLGSLMRGES